MTFLDAHLTPRGRTQASTASATFAAALAAGLPAPQIYFVSPLDRCLETCSLTFASLSLPRDRSFRPRVRELLRECIGEHTCDRRSERSAIEAAHPGFDLREGFEERDELWRPDVRETDPEMDDRLRGCLDELFAEAEAEGATWLSLTTHSGAMGSIMRVLGHRPFAPHTGSVMPIVVKAVERAKR